MGILAAFLAITPLEASAEKGRLQLSQLVHEEWQASDGLPQNSVSAIVRTQDGYLWAGTQEGLVRFDGVRFSLFDRHALATPSHTILALHEDGSGTLWIGTEGGLLRYSSGRFESISIAERPMKVRSIASTRDALWIATSDGIGTVKDGRFQRLRVDGVPAGVSAVVVGLNGEVWLASPAGVSRVTSTGVMTYGPNQGLPRCAVHSLVPEPEGSLLVGTASGGLWRLVAGRFVRVEGTGGLARASVEALHRDARGDTWIGTSTGLYRLAGGSLSSFLPSHPLHTASVLAISDDVEGGLWVGTAGFGLNRLREGLFRTYGASEGLAGESGTSAIYETRDGSIWVGTFLHGVQQLSPGRYAIHSKQQGLSSDRVWALHEDASRALWVGTYGGGLNRIKDGVVTAYSVGDGLSSDIVKAISGDGGSGLWIGTEKGLDHFDGKRFVHHGVARGVPDTPVRGIIPSRTGGVWLATGVGVVHYSEGRAIRYGHAQGVQDESVWCLYEDSDGTLWFGTTVAGLGQIQNGKVRHSTARDGMFDDVVSQILEDAHGNLWLSSNKGIARVAKRDLAAFAAGRITSIPHRAFDETDGMRSRETNGGGQPMGVRTRAGSLWFPTIRGAVVIDADGLHQAKAGPPVVIEAVRADQNSMDPRGRVEVGPGRGDLEVRFTALSLMTPHRSRFRYKLEGFDEGWIDAQDRRVAMYTQVPPGSYQLQVSAKNEDGVWSQEGASVVIEIAPHFYQRAAFRALLVLIAAGAAFAAHRLVVLRGRRREQELQRLVAERTAEIEKASRELERLAAQDGLTGIANRRTFDTVIQREWRRARRSGAPLSVLMLDVDHFKLYNDGLGHQAGDLCLKRVAAALSGVFKRPADLIARYGGEEFAAVLPDTDPAGARSVAERARAAVEGLRLAHPGSSAGPYVTVSVGVASSDELASDDVAALVAAADGALYEGKHRGRNRVTAARGAVLAGVVAEESRPMAFVM